VRYVVARSLAGWSAWFSLTFCKFIVGTDFDLQPLAPLGYGPTFYSCEISRIGCPAERLLTH
jgi:hypothetical protein